MPGDAARGLGVFARGVGEYNLQTARANAINADTAARWNEYVYRCQQETNRRYYARMARQKQDLDRAARRSSGGCGRSPRTRTSPGATR